MKTEKISKRPTEKKTYPFLKNIIYPLALFFIFIQVYSYIYDSKVALLGDNTAYYILGKALADGEGYTNVFSVNESPANHFPPGYPAIIAACMKVFSQDIQTIKHLNGFFFLGAILLCYALFVRFSKNHHLAFVTCLIISINYHMLMFSTVMMSEIPFLFISCLSLLIFSYIDLEKPFYKQGLFLAFIAVIVLAIYVRTAGVALLGGYVLYMLYNKKWIYALVTVALFISFQVPWQLRSKELGGSNYVKDLFMKNPYRPELGEMQTKDWFIRAWTNTERYITKEIPNACFPSITINYKEESGFKDWFIGLSFLSLTILGVLKAKEKKLLLAGYLLGTSVILTLWPDVWFGVRFILPIIPFVIWAIFNGVFFILSWIVEKLKLRGIEKNIQYSPFLLLFLISAFTPQVKALHLSAKNKHPDKFQNYLDIAEWAKENTAKDAVFSCRKPSLFYVFSDRKVTSFRNSNVEEDLIDDFIKNGIDYVVLDQMGYSSTGRYLYPAIQKYPEKFPLVLQLKNPDTYLLSFKPDLGYKGEWNEDVKEGKGSYKWENGAFYNGAWKDNKRSGYGEMKLPDGTLLKGIWENDRLVKPE